MNTIMTPKFMDSIATIFAEIRTKTCIDDVDVEVIKAILKDELNKYRIELGEYYEEEYSIAISSAQNRAYDDGHTDGYTVGYDNGYLDGQSESHSAV